MLDIKNIKVESIPQKAKFFVADNGYFAINKFGEIFMYEERDTDDLLIMSLQEELASIEEAIDSKTFSCREEFDELKSKAYQLESEIRFESESIRQSPRVCRLLSDDDDIQTLYLSEWKDLARTAKKNTVKSIARATGYR